MRMFVSPQTNDSMAGQWENAALMVVQVRSDMMTTSKTAVDLTSNITKSDAIRPDFVFRLQSFSLMLSDDFQKIQSHRTINMERLKHCMLTEKTRNDRQTTRPYTYLKDDFLGVLNKYAMKWFKKQREKERRVVP